MTDHSMASGRVGRTRVPGKAITALVLFAVALVFILQNRQMVEIVFFVPKVVTPLWAALGGVFVLGLATGYLVARRR
ncbi:MAG TPA: DUF1049 domain-containing protein [Pseudonocardiaceae bacterium]